MAKRKERENDFRDIATIVVDMVTLQGSARQKGKE